jgi:alkylated DNA repair protein (DNA oxidative demethylase)
LSFELRQPGLFYQDNFLNKNQIDQFINYFEELHPIWEMRFSNSNPPPPGASNRKLLRPVYWLGNWQFACLNYYHPPKGTDFRCVQSEVFPDFLDEIVKSIEVFVKEYFLSKDVPSRWHLNTCLINYYGDHLEDGKSTDCARVGEHKDFEPGPVASLSFGERALFQFVKSHSKSAQSQVVKQMWLDHGSLQVFGSEKYKKHFFHRVQRVERKAGFRFNTNTTNFNVRRINLTFRYVPTDHIQDFSRFPENLKKDITPYLQELAKHSDFFKSLTSQ